jgi:hypothetical protein
MELLNDTYNNFCKPKCSSYKTISNDITLIDNFFEDFKSARNFFINREKWKCILYQIHSKFGYESLFPNWVGRSLMEKYVLDNKISDDLKSYKIVCNHFYNDYTPLLSLSNSGHFPHYDSIENDGVVQLICLINLNQVPVSTKFYTFNDQEIITNEAVNKWNIYNESIKDDLIKFYGKENITKNEFKEYLDNKKDSEIKLVNTVEYKPNQAIVYQGNLFHSPNITQEFTEDNLRSLLRISFDIKIAKQKKLMYS